MPRKSMTREEWRQQSGFDWRWQPCAECDDKSCPCDQAVFVAYVGSVTNQALTEIRDNGQ